MVTSCWNRASSGFGTKELCMSLEKVGSSLRGNMIATALEKRELNWNRLGWEMLMRIERRNSCTLWLIRNLQWLRRSRKLDLTGLHCKLFFFFLPFLGRITHSWPLFLRATVLIFRFMFSNFSFSFLLFVSFSWRWRSDNVFPTLKDCDYFLGKGCHPYCYAFAGNEGGEFGQVTTRKATLTQSFHALERVASDFYEEYYDSRSREVWEGRNEYWEEYDFDRLHPKITKWLAAKRLNRWVEVGRHPFIKVYKGNWKKSEVVWSSAIDENFGGSHAAAFATFEDSLWIE